MDTAATAGPGPAQGSTSPHAPGSLVRARGREWVVLPESNPDLLVLRPLGGGSSDVAGVLPALEVVTSASFSWPQPSDLGDQAAASLLRSALRIGFRSSAGPFRSLAGLAVEPRPYQLVPLLMALGQDTVRLLIADDVGIGKTIESGLIAAELLAQGEARGLVVLCSPALAEQWRRELLGKFGIEAQLVLARTVGRLERELEYGASVFRPDRNYIVSTDFIKSPKYRQDFIDHCPDLVIVDEAHTCVAETATVGGGKRQRQLRYSLLQDLAKDKDRHLILVTATPHSGKEDPFRNLVGLLDPGLAVVDTNSRSGRQALAKHMVQRRRADIRKYLDEDTPFPSDRLSSEVAYTLDPAYRRLMEQVVAYARETVRTSDGALQQRVRWWSALALLRSLASSPAAAAQTLRTRAANLGATTVEEADDIGRSAVMDLPDDETAEAADAVPGARFDDEGDGSTDEASDNPERRRLRRLAKQADALSGAKDAKLARLTTLVRELLDEGYNPIVFCRFIPTAEYVATHLKSALAPAQDGPATAVDSVTGTLSPDQRLARIQAMSSDTEDGEPSAPRRVLVATDCLSEGVNLQDSFDAVVHYDLAWNPTRHEQREGRVDRFGQSTDVVRAITLYGTDNRIDGIVLDVLLRKHERIRRATGVSVPVPDESDNVMQAVLEGLLLRGDHSGDTGEQLELGLDLGLTERRDELHQRWQSAAEAERVSRSIYAQNSVKEENVAAEVAAVRAALGTQTEVRDFVHEALHALRGEILNLPSSTTSGTIRGAVREQGAGFAVATEGLPFALRSSLEAALGPRHPRPVRFHDAPTAPRGEAALSRTDPVVAAVARFVLDGALESEMPDAHRPARRCGVITTRGIAGRTTLLLVRFRFQLALPTRGEGIRHQIAEDAGLLAFRGSPTNPQWISEEEAGALLNLRADRSTNPDMAQRAVERVLSPLAMNGIMPVLAARAEELAEQLHDAHHRVRSTTKAGLRGLKVTPEGEPDMLGVYIYLPVADATLPGAAPARSTGNGSTDR